MAMAEEVKTLTANHKTRHALVSFLVPGGDTLHKVTAITCDIGLDATVTRSRRDKYAL